MRFKVFPVASQVTTPNPPQQNEIAPLPPWRTSDHRRARIVKHRSPDVCCREIPRGTLNVDRSLVRVGTSSQLDWKIQYPSSVTDVTWIWFRTSSQDSENACPHARRRIPIRLHTPAARRQLVEEQRLMGHLLRRQPAPASFRRRFWSKPLSTRATSSNSVAAEHPMPRAPPGLPYHQTGRHADKYVIVLKNGDTLPRYPRLTIREPKELPGSLSRWHGKSQNRPAGSDHPVGTPQPPPDHRLRHAGSRGPRHFRITPHLPPIPP